VAFSPGQACVFCGRPILEGEETVGRGQGVAHAVCADRALTDDAHWDQIAAQSGESESAADQNQKPSAPAPTSGRTGCMLLAAASLSSLAATVLAGLP